MNISDKQWTALFAAGFIIIAIVGAVALDHFFPDEPKEDLKTEYDAGYEDGYAEAMAKYSFDGDGYDDGYDNGYDYGYDDGYMDGRSECIQEVQDSLISSSSDQWDYCLEEAAMSIDDYLNGVSFEGVMVTKQEALDALDAFWCLIYDLNEME